ncbi:hypothetical protein MRX96_047876 [Rhipicephalus microplus]
MSSRRRLVVPSRSLDNTREIGERRLQTFTTDVKRSVRCRDDPTCATLTRANRDILNKMLRKTTKQALGVPIYSPTLILLDTGARNTVEELIEAHLSNQRIRLSHTEHGQAVLRKIEW